MKVSPRVRTQAIELLLCAADLRLRPKKLSNPNALSDAEFPIPSATYDLGLKALGEPANLAYAARVGVLADMRLSAYDPRIQDAFVILEAAKRLEEGWEPANG